MAFSRSTFLGVVLTLLSIPFHTLILFPRLTDKLAFFPLALSSSLPLLPRDDDDDKPGLHGTESLRTAAHIAHGVTISVAVVLFFPLGSIILRLMRTFSPS
jgi:hypothetical protein